MRIIPVIDILGAQVVHGVKGERHKYPPIKSTITVSTSPLEVAKAFKKHFSVAELYIADLDAILHRNFTFAYLEEIISKTQLRIMLDAGINEPDLAQELLKKGVKKVIIGTETLPSIKNLQKILTILSPEKIIVSLDLKGGKILSQAADLQRKSPFAASHYLEDLGIQEVIVLELTRVGSESGVMTEILRKILQQTSLTIITGGGARNIRDLKELQNAGVSGVLIATALHNGSITPQDLTSFLHF